MRECDVDNLPTFVKNGGDGLWGDLGEKMACKTKRATRVGGSYRCKNGQTTSRTIIVSLDTATWKVALGVQRKWNLKVRVIFCAKLADQRAR